MARTPEEQAEFDREREEYFANAPQRAAEKIKAVRREAEEHSAETDRRHEKSDTLSISGKGSNKICAPFALLLAWLVYVKDPKDTRGKNIYTDIQPQFRKILKTMQRNWIERERDVDESIGYKAVYYEPKEGDCAPTIAFRGTVGDGGIALHVKIAAMGHQWVDRIFTFTDDPIQAEKDKNMVFKKKTFHRTIFKSAGKAPPQPPDFDGPVFGAGADEAYKTYFEELDKDKLGRDQGEYGTSFIGLVSYEVEIKLYANDSTCRGADVMQAFGAETHHYTYAKKFGGIIAQQIMNKGGKRLRCTGHSMGGGLAVAAACAAKLASLQCRSEDGKACPDELDIECNIFNAAAVHENTVPDFAMHKIHVWSSAVIDELLTTVEYFRLKLPFIGKLMELSKLEIAENKHPWNLDPYPPLYPAPVADDMTKEKPNSDYAHLKRGQAMPKLWPLDEQTLIPGQKFPGIMALDKAVKKANSSLEVANILAFFAAKCLGIDLSLLSPQFAFLMIAWDVYNWKTEIEDLMKILTATADYHGMDVVAESILPPEYGGNYRGK